MSKFHKVPVLAAVFVGWSAMAFAGATPIDLPSISHIPAALTVVGADGEKKYDQSALEALGAVRMVTVTPWREAPAEFDGVLLVDLLEQNGLSDVDAIRVVAENDYAVVIPSEIWQRWDVLIATRVDGKPHSRRNRGPIQFVLPMSDDIEAGQGQYVNHWVWMAARIEVAD